jgi:ethanolamine utilization cobalamin adenosyltransferase
MRVITQAELRSSLLGPECKSYRLPPGAALTPDARDYLGFRGIRLEEDGPSMPVEPIKDQGALTFVNAETGEHYAKKPDRMTHLSGNRLVSKTNPRIQFRGAIDSLEAAVLEAQVLAQGLGEDWYCGALGEVLELLRKILGSEVREEPLPDFRLFGKTTDEIHAESYDTRGAFGIAHPIPASAMGALPVRLNSLRTQVREVELLAVKTFPEGTRDDIVKALNRLSSAIYWLFCKYVSERRRENHGGAGGEDGRD